MVACSLKSVRYESRNRRPESATARCHAGILMKRRRFRDTLQRFWRDRPCVGDNGIPPTAPVLRVILKTPTLRLRRRVTERIADGESKGCVVNGRSLAEGFGNRQGAKDAKIERAECHLVKSRIDLRRASLAERRFPFIQLLALLVPWRLTLRVPAIPAVIPKPGRSIKERT